MMNSHLSFRKSITILVFFFLLGTGTSAFGGITNISGVINDYSQVTGISCVGAGEITVSNASSFTIGDKVLLIQMQGAAVDQTNSAAFGTVSDLGSAGLYELTEIRAISGNTIFLSTIIENTYDPSGALQLVRVPVYDIANVNGELSAKAWDGYTGGILVFEAEEVRLGANINVTGKGFRGGAVSSNNGAMNSANYYYAANTGLGGFKGEGISSVIVGKECGKGPLANGGGGGNAHNCGGGGGANIGSGGKGGNWSSQANLGLGGKGSTIQTMDNRIFMGGGGGGGHQNNSKAAPGANGAGIVMILANTLKGNGFSIQANGSRGLAAPSNDGSGGAGAAGSILLDVSTVSGSLRLEASGAQGGYNGYNHGPGGGSGGGLIWTSADLPSSVNKYIAAGAAGLAGSNPRGATAGTPGQVATGLLLKKGSSPSGEICSNGIDDDCDGLIDCADSDCSTVDTDSDGVSDCADLDDDNDGLLDSEEKCGSLSHPFSSLSDANGQPSGRYYFDLGSGLFEADVDDSEGGGWVLIGQYTHRGGTNPNLKIIGASSNLPVTSNSALGADESGTISKWGHAGNAAAAQFNDAEELRFYGETSAHSRKIHFKTSLGISYTSTGTGGFNGLNTSHTTLSDHTAHVPSSTNSNYYNKGNEALTNFPFYRSGAYHWGIKGLGRRWEVDDYDNSYTNHTIHRIWIRSNRNSSCSQDIDSDGIPNHLDIDSDGDGCTDALEAGFTDVNQDGQVDGTGHTNTGLVQGSDGYGGISPAVTDPFLISIECDSDNDGISPLLDLDDDNDGIYDADECSSTNHARTGTATQISDYSSNRRAVKAIDGNTGPLEAHTRALTTTDWWQVDLGAEKRIDEVKIYNRTQCCSNRLGNVFVLVSNTPFPTSSDLSSAQDNADYSFQIGDMTNVITVSIPFGVTARYVRLQKSGDNPGGNSLNIYEVQVIEYGQCDTDNDGLINSLDSDSDGDGCSDTNEAGYTDANADGEIDGSGYSAQGLVLSSDGYSGTTALVTNPDLMTSACDSDGDGVSPNRDPDDDNDGIPDSIECQSYVDTDGDGTPDCLDIDSDNDGITDLIEGQSTADYIAPSGQDLNANGMDDAFDITCIPCGAITGVAITPYNRNAGTDSEPDYLDRDSDGDGKPDAVEAWDSDFNSTPEIIASGSDLDNDGLDDAFDRDITAVNTAGAVNGINGPLDLPDSDMNGEPDWRDASGTLPIELLAFHAENKGTTVLVSWVTASEINNDYFTIERSEDGIFWEKIGTHSGAGNSSTALYYEFTDYSPLLDVSYYRLKQTDFDLQFEYFDPVPVSREFLSSIQVYPNPAQSFVNIVTEDSDGLEIVLFDATGKKLPIPAENYGDLKRMNLSRLPSGHYLIVLRNGDQQDVRMLTIE